MITIQVPSARHGRSDSARAIIRDCSGKREVPPSVAVTIASWWQSSGSVGSVLASFASGMPVDRSELLEDIHKTRMTNGYFDSTGQPFTRGYMSEEDRMALDALSTFVLNY